MNEEELGFDPTIMTANDQWFIEIERNGLTKRPIIDDIMKRTRCIAGRATICWKAHREEDPRTPPVIKDSWQYSEREDEDETVSPSTSAINASQKCRSSTAGVKRSSSHTGAPLPPGKRSCSASPTKAGSNALPNQVHWRVILRDYGKPIYKASSRAALLDALEGCIEGHESLRKAGLLHRDISINNFMINEDDDNPSWPSFLIDLDLAIKEQREAASGARGR
jgi:hypothetical protein